MRDDVRGKLIELFNTDVGFKSWSEHIADHLIANGVTVQEWIPVTERLPKEFVSVLVYMPSLAPLPTVHEGYYVEEDECWMVNICGSVYTAVTHWMPLPEPPKEGE